MAAGIKPDSGEWGGDRDQAIAGQRRKGSLSALLLFQATPQAGGLPEHFDIAFGAVTSDFNPPSVKAAVAVQSRCAK